MIENHLRIGDMLLCGADMHEVDWTELPWEATCRACFAVARAESVDQRNTPHAFAYPSHCAECNLNDPMRAFRRDAPTWDGRW